MNKDCKKMNETFDGDITRRLEALGAPTQANFSRVSGVAFPVPGPAELLEIKDAMVRYAECTCRAINENLIAC